MSDSEDDHKGEAVPEEKVENLTQKTPKETSTQLVLVTDKVLNAMEDFRTSHSGRTWWAVFWAFVCMGVASRLHYITMPYRVVWDESHFGKMVGWYLNGSFFMDVHPVGGKLLLTLFGFLGGYNGTHSFATPDLPYEGYEGIMGMRVGCALMGSAMVPLAFHTVWILTASLPAATFAASLITFEIGTITLSKFILLDPLLMFFIMASFHGLCLIHSVNSRSWSWQWWASYTYTGAMLGCVMSVKFVGLFIVLVVGIYTIFDLWDKLGQLDRSVVSVVAHFLARALCLIVVPISIYVGIFFIHDQLLSHTVSFFAESEAHFSPGFQMTLKNNSLNNLTQPRDVAYGSIVTLRNANLAGVYLHSHNLSYPERKVGKNVQQVTGFRAKDQNNLFKVLFPEEDPDLADGFYNGQPEYVSHGDWVRLYHLTTGTLLSCSRNKSLVTKKHNLLFAKPYNLTDHAEAARLNAAFDADPAAEVKNPNVTAWQMWMVHIDGGKPGDVIHVLDTRLKFLCVPLTCALTWSKGKLPKWGFGQAEVTCSGNIMDDYTNWIVEHHINPYLPNSTYDNMKFGFLSRLVETHRVITWVNSRLTPEGDDIFTQHRPWMWPILFKAQVWYDVQFRIVLLGNPLVFWLNLVFLLLVPGIIASHYYKEKRGHTDLPIVRARKEKMVFACKWLLLAYALHYFPFYTMDRILYYHHYFPALQFSSMLTAVTFGYVLESLETWMPRKRARLAFHWSVGFFFVLLLYSFYVYCYVGYGHPTEGAYNPRNSTYRKVRFFDEWEI